MDDDHELDELVAALKLVGGFLTKSKPDQLKALVAGEASLGIILKGWKPMPPGSKAPAAPKAEVPPAARVRALLLEAPGPDRRAALLRDFGMNQTQARSLAKALGVTSAARSTTDQAIDKIVEHFATAGVGADERRG